MDSLITDSDAYYKPKYQLVILESFIREIIFNGIQENARTIYAIMYEHDFISDETNDYFDEIFAVDSDALEWEDIVVHNSEQLYKKPLMEITKQFLKKEKEKRMSRKEDYEFEKIKKFIYKVFNTTLLIEEILSQSISGVSEWPSNIALIPSEIDNNYPKHPQVKLYSSLNFLLLSILSFPKFETEYENDYSFDGLKSVQTLWISKLQTLIKMVESLPDILSFSPNKLDNETASKFRNVMRTIELTLPFYDELEISSREATYDILLLENDLNELENLVTKFSSTNEKRKDAPTNDSSKSSKVQKTACEVCGETQGLQECAGCSQVVYCSTKCQRKDWNVRHFNVCSQ